MLINLNVESVAKPRGLGLCHKAQPILGFSVLLNKNLSMLHAVDVGYLDIPEVLVSLARAAAVPLFVAWTTGTQATTPDPPFMVLGFPWPTAVPSPHPHLKRNELSKLYRASFAKRRKEMEALNPHARAAELRSWRQTHDRVPHSLVFTRWATRRRFCSVFPSAGTNAPMTLLPGMEREEWRAEIRSNNLVQPRSFRICPIFSAGSTEHLEEMD